MKRFYILRPTKHYSTVVHTRYGRIFKSLDAAVRLARTVGGSVFDRAKGNRLVHDATLPGGRV